MGSPLKTLGTVVKKDMLACGATYNMALESVGWKSRTHKDDPKKMVCSEDNGFVMEDSQA